MEEVQIVFDNDNRNVYVDGKQIGSIEYSTNPYHSQRYYLKLQLQSYDTRVAKAVFDLLSQKLNKPMQIMISSGDEKVVSFIQTAGFCCKRKCYEIEASVQDYVGKKIKGSLSFSMLGHSIYEKCCEIMLDRYISTHKEISPWTGTKEDFLVLLPEKVFYEMDNDKIECFAFVEDNEIAYVYGADRSEFLIFAQKLVMEMFEQNELIVFEADDCDEYAMVLKELFINQSEESFDTYVL